MARTPRILSSLLSLSLFACGDSTAADSNASESGTTGDGDGSSSNGDGDGDPAGDGDGTPGDGDGAPTGDGDGTPGDGDGDPTGDGDGDTGTPTQEQLRVAFIGDQGLSGNAQAVLDLVITESAEFVVIVGDFDYTSNPTAWDAMLSEHLGADFPVFAVIGNHDEPAFYGANGYQAKSTAWLQNAIDDGATCSGEVGGNSMCNYKGLFIAMSGVDVIDGQAESGQYLADALAGDDAIWSVCAWHKNQHDMQIGGKSDEAGWAVYQACQDHAGLIITGHEHSYARTLSLAAVGNAAAGHGAYGDPELMELGEGSTYVSVVGIGGQSLRDFEPDHDSDTWWASYYASNKCLINGVTPADCDAAQGALFIDFYVDGDPYKAHAYVKTINGVLMDEYDIVRDPLMTDGGGPDPDAPDLVITSFEDAYTDSASPNSNFGDATDLLIDADPSAYESFVKPLGVDAIPANAVVSQALLVLQSHDPGDDAEVHQVMAAWSEATITYANKPASGPVVGSFSTGVGPVEIDVTSIVQAWVDGAPVHGVQLRSDGGNGSDYYSSENGFDGPELRVWLAP